MISLRMVSAMVAPLPSKDSPANAWRAPPTDMPAQAAMSRPWIFTARLSGLSRRPPQSGHGRGFIRLRIHFRTRSLPVVR